MRKPKNPDHAGWHLCCPPKNSMRKWYVTIQPQAFLKDLKRLYRWLGKVIEYLEGKER